MELHPQPEKPNYSYLDETQVYKHSLNRTLKNRIIKERQRWVRQQKTPCRNEPREYAKITQYLSRGEKVIIQKKVGSWALLKRGYYIKATELSDTPILPLEKEGDY